MGVGVIPAAASAGKRASTARVKTITVADNYFSLMRLKVKRGQTVRWVWSRNNEDSHNVTLLSGPKGASKLEFSSANGISGIKFERTFLRPGKYHFQCIIHPYSMNTVVTVKS